MRAPRAVSLGFLAFGTLAATTPMPGCSSSSSTPAASSTPDPAEVAAADHAFEANLLSVQQAYEECVAAGTCKPFSADIMAALGSSVATGTTSSTSLRVRPLDADGGSDDGGGDDDSDDASTGTGTGTGAADAGSSGGGLVTPSDAGLVGGDAGPLVSGDGGTLVAACNGSSMISSLLAATTCCACAAEDAAFDDGGGPGADATAATGSPGLLGSSSIHPLDTPTTCTSRPSLCRALAPLIGKPHGYFAAGGNITAAAAIAVTFGGEIVWDLYNQQQAVFLFGGGGGSTNVSIAATGYFSYAWYNGTNILPAWSGQFESLTLDIGTPVAHLGVGITGFGNADLSMKGASLGISGGVSVLPVDITTLMTYAIANDTLTSTVGFINKWDYSSEHTVNTTSDGNGRTREYIQYTTGRAMGASIPLTLGVVSGGLGAPIVAASLPMAVYATAIGTLKERNFDYEKNCPH